MAKFSSKSTDWLDRLETVNRLIKADPNRTGVSLADELKVSSAHASYLITLNGCLDQAAIDKIRSATFSLSLNSALALAGLKGKVDDLHTAVHAALDVVLARQLATKDIKKLVAWVISGKPAAEFDPKAKPVRLPLVAQGGPIDLKKGLAQGIVDASTSPTNLDLKKLRQLLEKAEAERIQGNETTEQDKLAAYLRKIFGASPSITAKEDIVAGESISETVLLDWLADINVFKQIQSKRKKGKSLTGGEWSLLVLHKIGDLFGYIAKFFLELFKLSLKLAHWAWKMVEEALKDLGLYKYAKAIFTLIVVAIAIWFAWEAFHYGVLRPVEVVWSKIHFSHVAESPVESSNVESVRVDNEQSESAKVESDKVTAKPASHLQTFRPSTKSSYQPAISFSTTASPLNTSRTLYDPKILETEMAAIAPDSIVKDYPMTPDEGMPGDVAVSRMQDITDPDKYTMLIGNGKQIISSANPTNTTLTIHFKSADPFGLLGGGDGVINFLWEDVKYIHTNEVDVFPSAMASGISSHSGTQPAQIIYQCSLVVSGSKYPLTLQCATSEDLEHLVSTMQYFIRNSRLGHDTAMGGMPYLYQGLVLNNDGVVQKLWADSPMDKAAVTLGDHLWSIGKVTSERQGRSDLEKGLSQLPVTFFAASPSEWTSALLARNPSQANSFRPKLRKITLNL